MRILHLAWEYPPLVYGGLGRHIGALSRAQAAAGHDVTVVTQGGPGQDVVHGVRVVRVAQEPFSYRVPDLLTWTGRLDDRLARAAGTLGADVVHAHDWMVGRAGTATAAAAGSPLVATLHATEAGRHGGWLPDEVAVCVHLVEQWLADEADELIVCSAAMADEVRRAHGRTAGVTVIPNGIVVAGYEGVPEVPARLLEGTPRLTFVGRLEWEKGVFVALEALPQVLTRHPRARLRVVGTGGKAQAVAETVTRLGLESHVDLLGHVDEPTLRAAYTSSDLLLAPSSYEPFGLVALEGAAMGAPLVVGDAGGLAEFVTDDRGRRVPPNDPPALARAVLAALADPEDTRRRAERARAALADYTWQRIAARTVEVYARARVHPRPPRRTGVPDRRLW